MTTLPSPPQVQPLGVAVFAATYLLISLRRLSWLGFDRPAGALLGAVACVVLRVLTPAEAMAAIDPATLLLLFGVMGMGAFLALDGFFDEFEGTLVAWAGSPTRLLGGLVWSAGLLSALITNDAVCVLGAPLVLRLIARHALPPLPFLLALATAANTGSVATLVGNPQNMLCGLLGGLSYRQHLLWFLPLALIALAINHAVLAWAFRRELRASTLRPAATPRRPLHPRSRLTLAVIAASAGAYTLGAHLAWAATAGFVALMLLHRRDTRQLWGRIDWSILLFFAGLFVVVEGLLRSGAPAWVFAHGSLAALAAGKLGWLRLSGAFLVGSNLVSNVPFIMVVRPQMATLPDPRFGWELLAMVSTFAGNLTLLGSVANIIVAEQAQAHGGLGFLEHLRIGLPVTLLTTLVGALWLLAVMPLR